jgi:hypothetical protein
LAYASYIFLFQLVFSKVSQLERFLVLSNDYDNKRKHYVGALREKAVSSIELKRVSGRKNSFWSWYGITAAMYLIVVLLAVWAACDVLEPDSKIVAVVSPPTATTTSTGTMTATQTLTTTPIPTTPTSIPTIKPTTTPVVQLPTWILTIAAGNHNYCRRSSAETRRPYVIGKPKGNTTEPALSIDQLRS